MEYYKKYRLTENISLTSEINAIIHLIHSLPIVGKLTGDKYRAFGLKKFVHVLGPIFSLIKQVVISFLCLLFAIGISGAFIWATNIPWQEGEGVFRQFYGIGSNSIAFLAFYLPAAFSSNGVADHKDLIKRLNDQFNMDPKDIGLIQAIFDPLRIAIGRSLAFLLIFDLKQAIGLSFLLFFIRLTANGINLHIYRKREKNYADGIGFLILSHLICLIILKNFKTVNPVVLYIGLILSFIGSVISLRYLLNFDGYGHILEIAKGELSNVATDYDTIANESLALKDDDLERDVRVEAEGYKFLNKIFFERHRRLIIKPVLKRTAIMFVVMVIGLLLLRFKYESISSNVNHYIVILMAELMFILYNNESVCRAFFLNCDRALMTYGFYKDEEAIFSMYKYRYISLLKLSVFGLLAAFIAIGLGYLIFPSITIYALLTYMSFFIACCAFYPAFNLFNYYIFQPYNYEAKQIGKGYTFALSLMGYTNILIIPLIVIKGGLDSLLLYRIVAIAMIGLSIIFMMIVKVWGSKTFRIKQ